MSMKLVILGLLMEGDRHPYEIRQTMKERAMDHYIKMQDGSLYYAMDQLRKEGFVEAVEVVKDTSRPDKTIYRITESGKEKFQDVLMQQFDEKKRIYHPLHAALSFAHYGDPKRIAIMLKNKIKEQQALTKRMWDLYEEHIPIVPRSILYMMMGSYEHSLTELNWLKHLLKDAEEGRLEEIGTPLEPTPEEE
jgi:DNA-binding PadR family transcriptional regulator